MDYLLCSKYYVRDCLSETKLLHLYFFVLEWTRSFFLLILDVGRWQWGIRWWYMKNSSERGHQGVVGPLTGQFQEKCITDGRTHAQTCLIWIHPKMFMGKGEQWFIFKIIFSQFQQFYRIKKYFFTFYLVYRYHLRIGPQISLYKALHWFIIMYILLLYIYNLIGFHQVRW